MSGNWLILPLFTACRGTALWITKNGNIYLVSNISVPLCFFPRYSYLMLRYRFRRFMNHGSILLHKCIEVLSPSLINYCLSYQALQVSRMHYSKESSKKIIKFLFWIVHLTRIYAVPF